MKSWMILAALNASELNIPTNRANNAALSDILGVVYFLAGAVAVISIIIAGIYYVAANGDSGRVTKAKNTIVYSVIGLVIVMSAFIITRFVVGRAQ